MARKSTATVERRAGFVQLSDEEKLAVLRAAKREFDRAKTKEQVVEIIDRHFMKVGYKPLIRILRGKSPEDAMSRWGKAEE